MTSSTTARLAFGNRYDSGLDSGDTVWQALSPDPLHHAREKISRLLSGTSGWTEALGRKLGGLAGTPRDTAADSDAARQAQRQRSSRIFIHLLARNAQYPELLRLAQTTDSSEEAMRAVVELVSCKPAHLCAYLVQLADGDSYATIPAITALYNEKFTKSMLQVFVRRLFNGELFKLVTAGKAKPFSILDLMGASRKCGVTLNCVYYFEQVWNHLADDDKTRLLAEIFGDAEPGGFRYLPEKNLVPCEVKQRALELLLELKPQSYLRTLWYASRCDDDLTSWSATVALIDHWQTERGRMPPSLEPFAMLDAHLLFHLCQTAAAFQWRGPGGVMELYEQLTRDKEELCTLSPDSMRLAGLQDRIERAERQIIDITQQRVESLQPLIDTITRYLNLPHARLIADDTDACAAYAIGYGTVIFSRKVLLDNRPLSEEFMSSLLHELLHMEQDVLLIRMLADDLNLKFGQHAKLLRPLFNGYYSIIGYAPDSIFLMEVLRRRDDRLLTPEERRRAERLADAAVECSETMPEAERLSERLSRLSSSYVLLKDGAYDHYLLQCLHDGHDLRLLFQSGFIPGILLQEIESCREDLRHVEQIKGKLTKQAIDTAQRKLNESNDANIVAIVERLKVVLLEVLNEEWTALDKRYAELRRAGYHEAEAYEISDRVEVIVKAIRKGWY